MRMSSRNSSFLTMKTSSRQIRFLAMICTLILVPVGTMRLLSVSIGLNLTQSHPCTLFAVFWERPVSKGDLAAFRFAGSQYYREGTLFAKEVKGVPGDRVEIRRDGSVWLNGAFLDKLQETDRRGRPVTPFYFDGTIPAGRYFLYSRAANSYDSRYFGLVEENRFVGKVIPLLGC